MPGWVSSSTTPRSVRDTWSPAMAQLVEQKLAADKPDLIIASQIDTAGYVPRSSGVTALFEEVELGLMYEQFAVATTLSQRLRYGLTWTKHRRYLTDLLERFDACTVVSQRERQLLASTVPGYATAEVIPNFINLPDYRNVSPVPGQNTLIFTGAFTYHVNYEGALWFVRKVYPLVRAQVGDVALTITGNHANLSLPDTENVTLTGMVDDVRPLIAGAAVSVVPIWEGGGTRLKILEAMALRTPVVTTSKGAEGLDAQDGVHLLIADEPGAFANAVVRLLQDHSLRQRLAGNAFALVEQNYDWQVVMPHFLSLVDRLKASHS